MPASAYLRPPERTPSTTWSAPSPRAAPLFVLQAALYETLGRDAFGWWRDGFNATILGCGESGAGKTYSLFGPGGVHERAYDQHGLCGRCDAHMEAMCTARAHTRSRTYTHAHTRTLSPTRSPTLDTHSHLHTSHPCTCTHYTSHTHVQAFFITGTRYTSAHARMYTYAPPLPPPLPHPTDSSKSSSRRRRLPFPVRAAALGTRSASRPLRCVTMRCSTCWATARSSAMRRTW